MMVQVRIYDRTYDSIQALIFDKDGTLAQSKLYLEQLAHRRLSAVVAGLKTKKLAVNPERLEEGLQRQLFASWGLQSGQIDPAGLLAVASKRQDTIATAAYLTPLGLGWIEALQQVEAAFASVSSSPTEKARLTPPIPDLLPQLQRLQQSGLKLALLSADTQDNVQAFATTWHLESYFDLLMGEQPGLPKPNPALLHRVCDRLHLSPSEVLVLGDSAADIQLAKLGGAAGAIDYPAGWPKGVKAIPQADQRLESLSDLQINSEFGSYSESIMSLKIQK
jgi:phosphoglycolate phosphatase